MTRLILPYPPTVNHYWDRTKRGGLKISDRGLIFRAEVLSEANKQRVRTITKPAKFTLLAFPPDRKQRDLDNLFKSTLDALEKARVIANDNLVKEIYAKMLEPVHAGFVEVTLEVI